MVGSILIIFLVQTKDQSTGSMNMMSKVKKLIWYLGYFYSLLCTVKPVHLQFNESLILPRCYLAGKEVYVDSYLKWIRQKFFNEFINKKFIKRFYFFTCILPDYLCHESLKEFLKNSHIEKIRADFLRRCQNSLRQTSPEMMHFQAWKKNILTDFMSLLLIQLEFRHNMHLKMTVWISVLWKINM